MARLQFTVDDLVSQVRSQIDEQNQDSVDTELDILPALNRAQDYAMDFYARYYPDPLLVHTAVTLNSTSQEYDIPEDCFEDRISKIEVTVGHTSREVQRVSYRDLSNYESASVTDVPYYYAVVGRKYRLVPQPSGTYPIRLWYLRNPEKLVTSQGMITIVNPGSNYLVVDSAGTSLTTESDKLGSYVNIIDGQTGEVKKSLQIQSISDNKLTFRSSPTRTPVLNRTISTSFTASDIQPDDYVSAIQGSCIPYFERPTTNFLIQYAVAEMTRKLGGDASLELQVLDNYEKQVQRTWAGREQTLRVKKRSQNWGVPTRRWYFE